MKKIFLPIVLLCLLSIIFVPFSIKAAGLVPCGNPGESACGISDFFTMLIKIYEFIWKNIATPLAIIAVAVGGILMLISAGNPNLMSTGKKVFYSGIIGLVLVFCSYLIIDFILKAVGYTGSWSTPPQ